MNQIKESIQKLSYLVCMSHATIDEIALMQGELRRLEELTREKNEPISSPKTSPPRNI